MLLKRSLMVLFVCMTMVAVLPASAGDQIEQTEANLAQIKERLDQRGKDLETEWAALQQERSELDAIARGGTLQGSKKKRFDLRNAEFNDRLMKYQKDSKKLLEDIETYNGAVEQMGAAVNEGATTGADTGSAPETAGSPDTREAGSAQTSLGMSTEEMETTVARLNQTRKEMAEEYKALQQERQQIAAAAGGAQVANEQMNQLNQKLKDYGKRRQSFNQAVNDFNALTGQAVQTLPAP